MTLLPVDLWTWRNISPQSLIIVICMWLIWFVTNSTWLSAIAFFGTGKINHILSGHFHNLLLSITILDDVTFLDDIHNTTWTKTYSFSCKINIHLCLTSILKSMLFVTSELPWPNCPSLPQPKLNSFPDSEKRETFRKIFWTSYTCMISNSKGIFKL